MSLRNKVMRMVLRVGLTLSLVYFIWFLWLATGGVVLAADPTGAGTTEQAVNYVWILVSAFLVMFMQPGFAMLGAGFTRAKNAGNFMMKNLMDLVIGSLTFFLVGYAIMMGGDGMIFVLPVEDVMRVRTGEKGEEVLNGNRKEVKLN